MNDEIFAQNQAMIEIIAAMFEKGVVKINGAEGFLLASGKRAPVYIDHRKLFGEPGLREAALDLWCQVICEALPELSGNVSNIGFSNMRETYAIAGTATAGIAPGFGLACRLGLPFAYVRSKPKDHGLAKQVEGADLRARKIVVIDDMVTTGGSLLQACATLRTEIEASQIILVSSFSSKLSTIPQMQRNTEISCSFCSVFTLQTILKVGRESGLLQENELQKSLEWLQAGS